MGKEAALPFSPSKTVLTCFSYGHPGTLHSHCPIQPPNHPSSPVVLQPPPQRSHSISYSSDQYHHPYQVTPLFKNFQWLPNICSSTLHLIWLAWRLPVSSPISSASPPTFLRVSHTGPPNMPQYMGNSCIRSLSYPFLLLGLGP